MKIGVKIEKNINRFIRVDDPVNCYVNLPGECLQ